MNEPAASERALDKEGAATYLREQHSLRISASRVERKAQKGELPSYKVGKQRLYRPSLLDKYALGEWKKPKKSPRSRRKAS